jgi:hypothetical protein
MTFFILAEVADGSEGQADEGYHRKPQQHEDHQASRLGGQVQVGTFRRYFQQGRNKGLGFKAGRVAVVASAVSAGFQ